MFKYLTVEPKALLISDFPTPQVVTGIQDQEFTVTDVVEGKEYVFRVAACNKCGTGEPAYIDEPINVSSPASESQRLILIASVWFS